jgi:hypothetical protein
VPFKIEARLIQLGSSRVLPGLPETALGIKVDRPFARLHVLHATGNTQMNEVIDGTPIARYVVHYEDRTSDSIPVAYGRNIRDWWFLEGVETSVSDGKIAWHGKNRSATWNGATIGLYLQTWENPEPDKKVVSIDFSARPGAATAPFCVAMTVADKEGKDIRYLDLQPRANQRLDKDFHLSRDTGRTAPEPVRTTAAARENTAVIGAVVLAVWILAIALMCLLARFVPAGPPTDTLLACPVCGQETDRLKQYRYLNWCVYFGAGAVWQAVVHRACPTCMRPFLWRKCLVTALPANLLWLAGLLPWALCLMAASYRPSHSRAVAQGVTPAMAAAREVAQRDLSLGRVLAILAVLVFWLPVIGLVFAVLAYLVNRHSPTWTYRASKISLIMSGLVHTAIAFYVAICVLQPAR